MPDNTYPVFDNGQTLTAADLNMLRAFLHERDRLVGRMTGFGINCGLGGTVSGTTLTVAPGLAVDQTGEPLLLPEAQEITLPPTSMTPSYDFVDTAPGGFSVVLEATDEIIAQPDCGEANCAGHAQLHTRGVTVRTVAGRVTGTRMDFANEPLLTAEPIRLAVDSTPVNSFTSLRNALVTRLTNGTAPLVSPALIAKLQATSVAAADSPGVKGYKCGWLNMVLFATLDLLRVLALFRPGCDRSTTRPGVVVGWVHQVGSSWVFDCAFRHAWEPPRGLTEAFLGGSCTDPAGRYRDAVEALLAGYAPPADTPAGDPKPPIKCPKGSIRVGNKCVVIYNPPVELPDEWAKPWEIDPLGPIWYPPDEIWVEPWKVYESEPWDVFDDGVIGATDYFGHNADDVADVLDTFITGQGGVPDIRIVTEAELGGISGYHPAGGFSPSDTIVLTKNAAGVVVGAGRVAAVRNTRNVGNQLPEAVKAATDAQAAATELRGISKTVTEQVKAIDTKVGGLGGELTTLRNDFNAYTGGEFDLGGFGARLNVLEQQIQQFENGGFSARVSQLEQQITQFENGGFSARVGQLEQQIKQFENGGFSARVNQLEQQISQFENGGFSARVGELEAKFSEISRVGERTSTLEGRLDEITRFQR